MKIAMTDADQYGIAELMKLARAAEARRHDAMAYEAYFKVSECNPGRDSARFRAAWNSFDLGRVSEAKTLLAALGQPPKKKQWLVEFLLGQINMAQFKPVEAEAHFRKAAKLNPGSTAPAVLLGNCLVKQEKLEQAEKALVTALRAKGDLEEVYLNLALVMRMKRNYGRARRFLLKALRINPSYSDAKSLLEDVDACIEFLDKFRQRSHRKGKRKALREKSSSPISPSINGVRP